jgi:uncharacterized membrane protein
MPASIRFKTFFVEALGGLARRALMSGIALLGVLGATAPAAHASPNETSVRVIETDGVYYVSTTFVVPQRPSVVLAVLTDYERIPEFLTDVKVSRVLEHRGDRTLVEQEAVARLLFFSRRIHLALQIVETPGLIRFRDVSGKSFLRYEGAWRIVDDGHGARVTYELSALPTADVPATIVRRLLSRDVQKTIDQLTREIARRALPEKFARAD